MGIHISEESENKHTHKEIWESTLSCFFCKFIIASSFIIPVLILSLKNAIFVSVIWGFGLLSLLSYFIGKNGKTKTWKVVVEHLIIASVVVVAAHYVGYFISLTFG
jgi:VIT1/CCC1 family predicted Fe2+/Mn2+ transporter